PRWLSAGGVVGRTADHPPPIPLRGALAARPPAGRTPAVGAQASGRGALLGAVLAAAQVRWSHPVWEPGVGAALPSARPARASPYSAADRAAPARAAWRYPDPQQAAAKDRGQMGRVYCLRRGGWRARETALPPRTGAPFCG